MGLIKNTVDLSEIQQNITDLESISTEIKTNTEGITLSNESIKAIVDEIQNRIGLTGDTGGSASAGSIMSKLNAIIGSTASDSGSWEIPSIKQILTGGSYELSELGMQANTNYRLLVIPIGFSPTTTATASVGSHEDYKFKFYINDIDVYPMGNRDVLILPMCAPFNFKISTLSYTPKFYINGCFIFWLEDTPE